MIICPICRDKLIKENRSYKCKNNHTFDISKWGHINLLLDNRKHSKTRFEKIIFISVLPIDNVNMNKNIQKLNENIKNIERIEFLDVHNYFLNEHEMIDYKFTTDGTHLSNYGYEILNKEIFKII